MPLNKAIPKMVAEMNNAMLGAKSFQDIYHSLEKDGDKGGLSLIKHGNNEHAFGKSTPAKI